MRASLGPKPDIEGTEGMATRLRTESIKRTLRVSEQDRPDIARALRRQRKM